MGRVIWITLFASLLSPVLFGQEKEKKLDPCSLLGAADAASILDAPVPLVDRSKDSCTYGVLGGKMAGGGRKFDRSITFSVKTYKSEQARDKEWAKMTEEFPIPVNKDSAEVEVVSEIAMKLCSLSAPRMAR